MFIIIFLALISLLSSPSGYCFDLSISERSFTRTKNDREASFKVYKQFANELHAQLKDQPHPTKVYHPIFAFLAKHLLGMAQKNKNITWEADVFKQFYKEIVEAKARKKTNYEWFIYFMDRCTILLTHPKDRKDKQDFTFNTYFDQFKFSLMSDDDWKDQEKYKLKVKNMYKNVKGMNYGFVELINKFPDVVITPYPYELDMEELLDAELTPDQHFAPAGIAFDHVDADGTSMPPAIFFTHDIQHISAAVEGLSVFGLRMKFPPSGVVVQTLKLKKVDTAKRSILKMRNLYFRTVQLIKRVLSTQKRSIQNYPTSDESLTSYQANTFFAFLLLHEGWNNALGKMSNLFDKGELSRNLENNERRLNDKKYYMPILPDRIKGLRLDIKIKVLNRYLDNFYLLLDAIPEFVELQKEFFALRTEFLHINEFIFDNNSWKDLPLFVDAGKPLPWLNFISYPYLGTRNLSNFEAKESSLSQIIYPHLFPDYATLGPHSVTLSQNSFYLEPHYVLQNSDCSHMVLFHCGKLFETKTISSNDIIIDYYTINDEERKRSRKEEYNIALIIAVNSNDIQAVRNLLALGAEVNCTTNDGNENSPLHFASENNYLEIVELLVDEGAELNKMNKLGSTPINLAAKHGRFDVVKFLHQRGANLETTVKGGSNPVFSASLGGHFNILKYLIESGANKDLKIFGNPTLLHQAAKSGNLDSVKYLIHEQGADMNKPDTWGDFPFHEAVSNGNLSVAKFFVEELKIDINQPGRSNDTALYDAVEVGDLELIEYLESKGGNRYDINPRYNTPLHLAVELGRLDVVKHFIESEPSKERLSKDSENLLRIATRKGHLEVMKYLLEALPSEGRNRVSLGELLCLGAKSNSLDIVRYLIGQGVNINTPNKKGKTPLALAKKSWQGNDVEKYLIRQGAL